MRQFCVILFFVLLPLHLAWAGKADCTHRQDAAALPASSVSMSMPVHPAAVAEAMLMGSRAASPAFEMPGWQFDQDEIFDVIELVSAPEWSNVSVDDLSCRVPADDSSPGAPPADPHEAQLPTRPWAMPPSGRDTLVAARSRPLLSATVFKTDRPPRLAA